MIDFTITAPRRLVVRKGFYTEAELGARANLADRNPTPAQIDAGNYRKGHVRLHGLDITIENPKGSTRSGVGADGKPWSVTMRAHYGYIKRTESEADGDHIDVFVGPHPESEAVFVIDQNKTDGRFDEHKCMLGYRNAAEAKAAYLANYSANWTGFRAITPLTIDQFKQWIEDADTSKPAEDRVEFLAKAHVPAKGQLALPLTKEPVQVHGHTRVSPTGKPVTVQPYTEQHAKRPVQQSLAVPRLPDDELGAIHHDYVRMDDPRVGAYPSKETIQAHARWARRKLSGEKTGPTAPHEFARFVRVRLEGKRRGHDLRSAIEAFRAGKDVSPDDQSEPKLRAIDPAADYKQNGVRAKSFKAWFGDWERDPANASKVVNAKGEPQETHPVESSKVMRDGKPIVVYHGTAHGGFATFDKTKVDKDALYGPGFYFTEDKEVAESYTQKDEPAPKPLISPLNVEAELHRRIDATSAEDVARAHVEHAGRLPEGDIGTVRRNLKTTAQFWKNTTLSHWKRHGIDVSGVLEDTAKPETKTVYLNIRKPFDVDKDTVTPESIGRVDPALLQWSRTAAERDTFTYDQLPKDWGNKKNELLQRLGYDGITHIGGTVTGGKPHRVWIAFDPNQIKAVDNVGTFDPNNDDITKSLAPGRYRYTDGTETGEAWIWDAAELRKAHVRAYQRTMPGGAVVQVREYDRKDVARRMETDEAVTNSVAFQKWFGDSNVVDETGKPRVVYHGTDTEFRTFRPASELLEDELDADKRSNTGGEGYQKLLRSRIEDLRRIGEVYFFSEEEWFARDWADVTGKRGVVMPVYLRVENPAPTTNRDEATQMMRENRKYDGARVEDTRPGGSYGGWIWMVRTPTQIKSAERNSGWFDPHDPDIYKSFVATNLEKARRWITVHPGGDKEAPGHPVLIEDHPDGTAHVIAGMGAASRGMQFLKLKNLKSPEQLKAAAKLKGAAKRKDYHEQLKRKAQEYAGGQPVTKQHVAQARAHLKGEAEKFKAIQTAEYKAHVSHFAPLLGMSNWEHDPAGGQTEHQHWRAAYRKFDQLYHRSGAALIRDHELVSGVIAGLGEPLDISDLLPDAPRARGLGYQRTTRREAAEGSEVPEVEAVRAAFDHSEDAGRDAARQAVDAMAGEFAQSKLPSDQHYGGELKQWLEGEGRDADQDAIEEKVAEAADERTKSGFKASKAAPDPLRAIQQELKGMQSREARQKALAARKNHKIQVGDQIYDPGVLSQFMRGHKKFKMEQRAKRTGRDEDNVWGQGIHVDYSDVDRGILQDLQTEQTAARNESFLHEVERAAADPTQPGPANPARQLRQYLSEGTFNGLNYASGAVLGGGVLGRRAVDLLGLDGASQLVAKQIARRASDPATVRQALVDWHEKDHAAAIDEAVRESREAAEQAEAITIPPIHSADDLAVAAELSRTRRELLADSQAVVGRTLGELEAAAALINALGGPQSDAVEVSVPNGSVDAAIRELHALGLTDEEFDLQPSKEDGKNAKLAINPSGQDKLAQPPDPEAEKLYQDIQAIKRGDHDEDDWLPPGFARRASDLTPPDSLPDLAFRQRLQLSGTSDPSQIHGQVSDYVLAQYNNGRSQKEIRDDLLSGQFAAQHGLDSSNVDAFVDAVDTVLPTVQPHDYAWGHTADLRDEQGQWKDASGPAAYRKAFREGVERAGEAERHNEVRLRNLSGDFAQRVGGSTPALHDQSVDIDDPQVHEAAFRALAETPTAVAAWRAPGMMSRSDRQALRDHFWKTFAKEKPGEFEARFTEGTGGRHPGKDWQVFVAKSGGADKAYAAVQENLRNQSGASAGGSGGLFGGSPEPEPLATARLDDPASLVEAVGDNKHLLREGLATGDAEWKARTHEELRKKAEHQIRNHFFTEMAGYKPHELEAYHKATQDAAGDAWDRYVTMMGGDTAAYDSLRHDVKGQFLERFAKHHETTTGKQIKAAEVELPGADKHKRGVLPEDEAKAAIAAEQSKKARELALVAERSGGKFAGGERKEKAERLREAIKRGGQRALFASDDDEATRAPSTAAARGDAKRVSIGDRAENQLARIVEHVGKNFDPRSKGLKIFGAKMSGERVLAQRGIKAALRAKRLGMFFSAGSGKTNVALGTFTSLHDQGNAKRALFAVPGQVQGQMGAEINRFLEPGKYQHWAQPGASRAARLAAHRNADNHISVVTHQSLRDDTLHLLKEHGLVQGDDEMAVSNNFNAMPREQRAAAVKKALDAAGINYDMLALDEGHDALNRRGKENSTMANVMDAISDNTATYLPMTADPIKNDPSEAFDWLSKLRSDKYPEDGRNEWLRRYGSNTSGSQDALHREIASSFYAANVPTGTKRQEIFHDEIKLHPEQQQAHDQVGQDYARAVRARDTDNWSPEAVESMKRLAPTQFAAAPEAEHAAVARKLSDSLGVLRETALSRVVNTHPNSAKLDKLAEIVRKERANGQPGIVFAHHRDSVKAIVDRLRAEGHRVGVLDGSMGGKEKDKARLAFQPEQGDPEHDVLVMSDAGATGINAQRGQFAVQYDLPMTHKTAGQRVARIDRLGQQTQTPIRSYTLATATPFERTAMERLNTKRELANVFQSSTEGVDDSGLGAHLNRLRSGQESSRVSARPVVESLPGAAA